MLGTHANFLSDTMDKPTLLVQDLLGQVKTMVTLDKYFFSLNDETQFEKIFSKQVLNFTMQKINKKKNLKFLKLHFLMIR